MIKGNLAGGKIPNKLPFNMIVDTIRRKKFMDAFKAEEPKIREEGEKVRKVVNIINILFLKIPFSSVMRKSFP